MIDLVALKRKARDKEPFALLYGADPKTGEITAQAFQVQAQIKQGTRVRAYNGKDFLGFVAMPFGVRLEEKPPSTLKMYELYLNGTFRRLP